MRHAVNERSTPITSSAKLSTVYGRLALLVEGHHVTARYQSTLAFAEQWHEASEY